MVSKDPEKAKERILLANEYNKDVFFNTVKQCLLKRGYQHVEIWPISLNNYLCQVSHLKKIYDQSQQEICVFQLCDGTELDGYPGSSIIAELERQGIPFTGANKSFYGKIKE